MNLNFKFLKEDFSSSLVVFLVALPLCLGVGQASTDVEGINGIPISGLLAGIVGGVLVGLISRSRIGVSGPAAGLITIIIAALLTLKSYEGFLVAIIFAGILQVIAGYLKLGVLANYFPSSVIKGMLAAIGITLILKEIPHAVGYDKDFFGDESFFQMDGENTFSELFQALGALHPGAVILSLFSILVLILFDKPFLKKIKLFKILPGALFVVLIGIGLNLVFPLLNPQLEITGKHLVQIPVATSFESFTSMLYFPDFSFLSNPQVYIIGATIALVASLETLLSVEATDKLDPEKYHTPKNLELKAQGIGNIASGLIGGLPITQVIVRSSANVNSGAKTKLSTIIHGLWLAVAILIIPSVLNLIPLSALAAILILVGYKLAKIELFKSQWNLGFEQFIPFISTILGVLFTDLLKGIAIGMVISVFYILRKNYRNNYQMKETKADDGNEMEIILSEEVSFLNKGSILETLTSVPEGTNLTIDGSKCREIDFDVLEVIQEFKDFGAPERKIKLKTINIPQVAISGGH
jgi:MFS superfamily sulfate permease-like transporter